MIRHLITTTSSSSSPPIITIKSIKSLNNIFFKSTFIYSSALRNYLLTGIATAKCTKKCNWIKAFIQPTTNALIKINNNYSRAYLQKNLIFGKFSTVFISGLFFGASATAASEIDKMATPITELLQNSDQLFDENKYQDALDVLNSNEDQTLADIKWRQARAMYKLSKSDDKTIKKDELIRAAFELAKDAVTKDDNNFAAHKWMAVLLDSKSELDGIKERVSQLHNVKHHMQRAVELNPDDPTSWHLLGNFSFGLADMPWYQRKIVSTIFATPPTGTYEEALEHFLRAEEKKANFYSPNLLFIAKCYQRLKNDEQAKHWLKLASSIQVVNEDDKRCQEEAASLLKKY